MLGGTALKTMIVPVGNTFSRTDDVSEISPRVINVNVVEVSGLTLMLPVA